MAVLSIGYSRALRRITHHLDKSPDTLTTDDLKRYFAQLIKTHSSSTVRINRNGLRKLWLSYVFYVLTFFFLSLISVISEVRHELSVIYSSRD